MNDKREIGEVIMRQVVYRIGEWTIKEILEQKQHGFHFVILMKLFSENYITYALLISYVNN